MRTICVLLCSMLLGSAALSQTESEFLKTKCLSFSFDGFDLGALNGGIGGKIWTSDATAFTLTVAGSFGSSKTDGNAQRTEQKQSVSYVRLQAGFEQHTDLANGFSPYLAEGVFGSFRTQKYTYSTSPPATGDENKQTTNAIGAVVGFGVEYWFTNRISVAGQQLFQGSYQFGSLTDGLPNSPSRNTSGFDVSLGTSSLILSIYF